ncbi:MAG TPA: POTRA domain-containing protein, partial [Kiloniellales bacterium]|nr:POTRA domain-containing protein [Kiloniellales bacterium]
MRGLLVAIGLAILPSLVLTAGPWSTPPARAQSLLDGGIIEEIRIEGTQRIDPESIRSYMRVNPGDPFDPVALDRSLKNIFATGLFADVTLRREGDTLI